MGFNISGIAINSNYENKIQELQKDLGFSLEFIEEVYFETASANWTDSKDAFIYFDKESTLIFLNSDFCDDSYDVDKKEVLTFALFESSMAFYFSYTVDKKLMREVMEVNGDYICNEGSPLPFEDRCDDTSEMIWTQLDKILSTNFHSIELGEKAYKYKISFNKVDASDKTYDSISGSDLISNDLNKTNDIDEEEPKLSGCGCVLLSTIAILIIASIFFSIKLAFDIIL